MKVCEYVKVISLPYIFQVLYVLCFTRPRYQVSIYRTIGPLVYIMEGISEIENCKRQCYSVNRDGKMGFSYPSKL